MKLCANTAKRNQQREQLALERLAKAPEAEEKAQRAVQRGSTETP